MAGSLEAPPLPWYGRGLFSQGGRRGETRLVTLPCGFRAVALVAATAAEEVLERLRRRRGPLKLLCVTRPLDCWVLLPAAVVKEAG